jgi:hypothetical protein
VKPRVHFIFDTKDGLYVVISASRVINTETFFVVNDVESVAGIEIRGNLVKIAK